MAPTHRKFFAFAAHAYRDNADRVLPAGWAELSLHTGQSLSEALLEKKPALAATRCFARAYYCAETKELVLAFAGTENAKELGELKSGWDLLVQNKFPAHNAACYIYQRCLAIRKPSVERIYLTGHSKGAIHAELLAIEYEKEAVTFESPGCFQIAQKRGLPDEKIESARNTIVNYLALPNSFNHLGKHVGEIRFIETKDAEGLLDLTRRQTSLASTTGEALGSEAISWKTALAGFGLTEFAVSGIALATQHPIKELEPIFTLANPESPIPAQQLSEEKWGLLNSPLLRTYLFLQGFSDTIDRTAEIRLAHEEHRPTRR